MLVESGWFFLLILSGKKIFYFCLHKRRIMNPKMLSIFMPVGNGGIADIFKHTPHSCNICTANKGKSRGSLKSVHRGHVLNERLSPPTLRQKSPLNRRLLKQAVRNQRPKKRRHCSGSPSWPNRPRGNSQPLQQTDSLLKNAPRSLRGIAEKARRERMGDHIGKAQSLV